MTAIKMRTLILGDTLIANYQSIFKGIHFQDKLLFIFNRTFYPSEGFTEMKEEKRGNLETAI
jgi:hypothetical protein